VLGEHRRAIRRPHAGAVEEVLDAEREPEQRAVGPTVAVRGLRLERLLPRAIEAERRERADLRVQLRDPRSERVDDLDGRELARAVRLEQLDGVEGGGVRHDLIIQPSPWQAAGAVWKGRYRCAVTLSVDFDAESLWSGTFKLTTPSPLSRGDYDVRAALPR